MDQIRLTCGGCHKRYRLPGNATGYFRCRKCDLVMAIPTGRSARVIAKRSSPTKSAGGFTDKQSDSVFPLEESDELIDEIAVDPETGDVIHVDSTSGQPGLAGRDLAARSQVRHVKRQASVQPSDAALLFIGAGMTIGGWLTMIMQLWPKDESGEPGVIALSLGFLVGLTGVGLFGFGLRHKRWIQMATAIPGTILTIAMLGKGLIPEESSEPKTQNSIAEQDSRYDPGQSRFSLGEQRKRNRDRAEKLDELDLKLDSIRSTRPDRQSGQPDSAGRNPSERTPESLPSKNRSEDGKRSIGRDDRTGLSAVP